MLYTINTHDMNTEPEPDAALRVNISISKNIHDLGKQLAKDDHRDFSNEVEWLIEKAWREREAIRSKEVA